MPVAARNAESEDVSGRLPRLPPGRHGLERDYVTKNQRDRLTVGVIAAVAADGYHDATITRICAAAGVSRRTFYTYFSSKEECYLQAFDLIGEHLERVMEEAGTAGGWPDRVAARLRAMLETFAANPDLVRFSLIAPVRAGEKIATYRRSALERIRRVLVEDLPASHRQQQPSPAIQESLVGGMMALVAQRVDAGEGERLTKLLPDLVELFLTSYIGRAEAVAAAERAVRSPS